MSLPPFEHFGLPQCCKSPRAPASKRQEYAIAANTCEPLAMQNLEPSGFQRGKKDGLSSARSISAPLDDASGGAPPDFTRYLQAFHTFCHLFMRHGVWAPPVENFASRALRATALLTGIAELSSSIQHCSIYEGIITDTRLPI